jgi:hypothetical protein
MADLTKKVGVNNKNFGNANPAWSKKKQQK